LGQVGGTDFESRIAYMAYHDELTGLPNRAMFREHLELALARTARNGMAMAVLYLDLNRFKLVNDSLGHAAGDELLRQAAARLAGAVRASDLIAREGGDEFIVLLADLDPSGAEDIAERVASAIHAALRTPFTISGEEFYIGTAVGIALYSGDDGGPAKSDGDELLSHADAAMYEAKQAGAPTAVYRPPEGDPLDRLGLITRLHKAIERMDFTLHWLPIIDLNTQSVCGMEALMRWRDPVRGWVPPTDFIALLEENGMIDQAGLWALGEAAGRQAAWREEGLDLDVGVNISTRQLWKRGAGAAMLAAITAGGGDRERFVLEVAEANASRTADRAAQALAELRAAGVRIALDDFSHSPLTTLSRMEFDVLKIDGSLVRGADNPEGQTMVNAIVQLARNLAIWPLAEGIETRAQFEVLRDAGCRFGQGYFFARPLPAEDVPRFVRTFDVPADYDPWIAWESSRIGSTALP
jgi:diguanylate cyclase (GGDEF)-like protein